jgi:hypothetical protein
MVYTMSYAGGRPEVPLTESPLPLKSLFTGNLSKFGAMVQEHGIPAGTKTLIAFTDKAWFKLIKRLEESQGRTELTRQEKSAIAAYALSPDPAPYAETVLTGEEKQLDTFSGSPISMSCENGALLVRDVRQQAGKVLEVIRPAGDDEDVHIYVVDRVFIPTSAQLLTARRD